MGLLLWRLELRIFKVKVEYVQAFPIIHYVIAIFLTRKL